MTTAGLWGYGDWRHVATGCNALVYIYTDTHTHTHTLTHTHTHTHTAVRLQYLDHKVVVSKQRVQTTNRGLHGGGTDSVPDEAVSQTGIDKHSRLSETLPQTE